MVVVAGGYGNGHFLSTVECLSKDLANDNGWAAAWKRLAPMQQPRIFFGLVDFRDRLIAVGGRTAGLPNFTNTASVELFQPPDAGDPDGIGVWTRITDLPRPLLIYGLALSTTAPNELLIFGESNAFFSLLPADEQRLFKFIPHPEPDSFIFKVLGCPLLFYPTQT